MKRKKFLCWILTLCVSVSTLPPVAFSQEEVQTSEKVFKQEELDQILAPIALYSDELLAQIFMAATYPLEVVQAQRWVTENKDLTGEAVTAALEKESWDPSVKSLVAFPQVLTMMNEKLDWTQKLGDAFLSQQKDVMATVQRLREKAQEQGNLKSTKEQNVIVQEETIIIEDTDPEVVYVPVYNPSIVYGTWWYPSYPPYYYYPPYYPPVVTPYYGFAAGIAVGVAWGYAWGHCDWDGGDVNIDIDRNTEFNRDIDRDKARQNMKDKGLSDKGQWKHDADHRKGVSYRDDKTAKQYDRMASSDKVQSREEFRGRAETAQRDLSNGRASKDYSPGSGSRDASRGTSASTRDVSRGSSGSASTRDVSRGSSPQVSNRASSSSNTSAFDNMDRGGSTRSYSAQGKSSRSSASYNSSSRGGASRSSYSGASRGGGGGGSRGGGGGSRGGGGGRR